MTLTAKQMKSAHRHKLELILLGMALSTGPERKQVLDDVSPYDLQSETINDCFQAIIEQDMTVIRGYMRRIGVEINGTIVESLINRLKELHKEDEARDVLQRALDTGCVDDLSNVLESALCEIRG